LIGLGLLVRRAAQTLDAITPEVKLLFLCSPGNPTAKALPIEDIEAVVSSPLAQNVLIVVDEAYVDFSTRGSAVSLIGKYPNVVVLQTLSKAFGLAAIRCGFCLGPPDVIQLMNNVKAPYNVNALTSKLALDAFDSVSDLSKNVASLLEQRERVAAELMKLDFVTKVFPSDSNFLLFRLKSNAKETYKAMADGGVVTRYRGTEIHCDECIRVTIGTPEENTAFFEALVKTYHAL
jgi:histidinol-phosphate aminotransferase